MSPDRETLAGRRLPVSPSEVWAWLEVEPDPSLQEVFRFALGLPAAPAGPADLGLGLKLLRLMAGLTQDALAERIGVSNVTVSHIEGHRDGRMIDALAMFEWARACGRAPLWALAPRGAPKDDKERR